MTKDELKLALKHATRDERHLSNAETRYWCDQYKLLATQAIEALAQPEQEPVAIEYWLQDTMEFGRWVKSEKMARATAERMLSGEFGAVFSQGRIVEPTLPPQPKEPEQEPVAWIYESVCGNNFSTCIDPPSYAKNIRPLYNTSPQRKPLTDEMHQQMKESCDSDNMEMRGAFIDGWTSAEAAHGIKE